MERFNQARSQKVDVNSKGASGFFKVSDAFQKGHWENRMKKLEMWPMSNVMAALPNIGGALCSTPQSLADAHY